MDHCRFDSRDRIHRGAGARRKAPLDGAAGLDEWGL
jgi:hypothetical protein